MSKSCRRAWLGLMLAILGGLTAGSQAWADRIVLRGGGELRGKIVPAPDRPEKMMVQTEKGKAPTAFEPGAILKIIPVSGPLDEYFERRNQIEPTAEAEFALARWCESAGLTGLADGHYRRTVELDPEHASAHKKLGHVEQQGQWMTPDEARQAQGLVKAKGKWVLPEEKARQDSRAAFSTEQASWARRIKVLRQALFSEKPEVHRSAERQFLAIQEPAAAWPIARAFAQDEEDARRLAHKVVAGIPGPESLGVLVDRSLGDQDGGLRREAINLVAHREDVEAGVALYVRALRHKNPVVAGHAAQALAGLDSFPSVPKLIAPLVTVQQQVVDVIPGASAPSGPTFISGGGPSVGVITGIAAGPGAIGFGAVGVPVFSGVAIGGGVAAPRLPEPRLVQYLYNNQDVLEALVKLTGVNFGYDQDAWKRWIATSFQVGDGPKRRIPQP